LENDAESTEWINNFMSKFWLIYEPVLSSTVVGIVDGILVDQTPAFLDSIRLTTFTLGTKAPRVESIKSFPKSDPDVVVSPTLSFCCSRLSCHNCFIMFVKKKEAVQFVN
jgi:Ca2+-dependent lipid-binding protein